MADGYIDKLLPEGTDRDNWVLGTQSSGIRLKDDSGVFTARNNGDTDYVGSKFANVSTKSDGYLKIGLNGTAATLTRESANKFESDRLRISPNAADALELMSYGSSAGETGEHRYYDLDDSNYVGFKARDTIASNLIWSLPNVDGDRGEHLTHDGSGNLVWHASSRDIYFPVPAPTAAIAGHPSRQLGQNERAIVFMYAPSNLFSVEQLDLIVATSGGDLTGADIDLSASFGDICGGEAYNVHTASDTSSTYNLTGGEFNCIDLTTLMSSFDSDDLGNVIVTNKTSGLNKVHVVGVILKYKVTAT